jgi:hypothetical protein
MDVVKKYNEFASANYNIDVVKFPVGLLDANPRKQSEAFKKLGDMLKTLENYRNDLIEAIKEDTKYLDAIDDDVEKQKIKTDIKDMKNQLADKNLASLIENITSIHPELLAQGRIGYEAMQTNRYVNFQKHFENTMSMYNDYKGINAEIDTLKGEALLDQRMIDLNKRKAILKSKGLEATKENLILYQKELDAIMNANKVLGSTKVKSNLLTESNDAKLSFMSRMGYGEEASIVRALKNAYDTKGSALTKDESDLVKAFARNEWKMENIKMPEIRNNIIHTNELAAKGGFSSSVAVERKDSTNLIENFRKEVYKLWQQQLTLDTQIRNSLKN